jgi:Mevalonate kinase
MTPDAVFGYAPGKVILFGEHAVVYGQPAIAATIDRGIRVAVSLGKKDTDGPVLGSHGAGLPPKARPDPNGEGPEHLREALARLVELCGERARSLSELNPFRANITQGPADYRWSSYHCNALGQPDPLIEPHEDYLRLGTEPAERQAFTGICFGCTSTQSCLRLSGKPPRRTGCLRSLCIAKRKPGPRKKECSLG